MNQSLADEINAFQEKFLPSVPSATLDTMRTELGNLLNSEIAEQAKTTGAFPDFALADANNQETRLSDLLSNGPLVINFYRGAWCPYCNLELNALQHRLPEIEVTGARLVAISPQVPEKSRDQLSLSRLNFDVLSDVGNELARDCGLVFTLPESLRPIYAAWEIDIPSHNGDDLFELPIPATYIIDGDGRIRFSYINMDYTQRLEPDIIIEQLNKL